MATILITGACGFIGGNLSRHLVAGGHRLWGLDVAGATGGSYEAMHTWDRLDAIEWDAVDALIHLAGKAHDTRRTANPQDYFDINVGLTRRVFDRYLASRARTFVLFSSVKAVADTVIAPPLTEQAPPDPRTPYGRSKLEAEAYIRAQPGTSGRNVCILRPCMVHGPGNKGNLNLLWNAVNRGLPYPLGSFSSERSFTSIGNLCCVIDRIVAGGLAAGVYNVCDDAPVTMDTLILLIAVSLRRRPRIWHPSPGFVRWCAAAGDRLHLPLTTERLNKLTESYVVSNAKLRAALGIAHLPVSAEDGLRQTLRSFGE